MYAQMEIQKENKNRAVAHSVSQKKGNGHGTPGFVDNREEAFVRRMNLAVADECSFIHMVQRKAYDSFRDIFMQPGGSQHKASSHVHLANFDLIQRVTMLKNLIPGDYKIREDVSEFSPRECVPFRDYSFVVMDGKVLISLKYPGSHPHLSGGKDVEYAGMLVVVNNELAGWNNHSGHYFPPENLKHQAPLDPDLFQTWKDVQDNGWKFSKTLIEEKETIVFGEGTSIYEDEPLLLVERKKKKQRCCFVM